MLDKVLVILKHIIAIKKSISNYFNQCPDPGRSFAYSVARGRSRARILSWALQRSAAQNWLEDETSMTAANDLAVRRALEAAGVEFIDENGGGPGVRLRKPKKKSV